MLNDQHTTADHGHGLKANQGLPAFSINQRLCFGPTGSLAGMMRICVMQAEVIRFNGKSGTECHHEHRLQGTGAVFFQSVGLLQCIHCGGWQMIRKPI